MSGIVRLYNFILTGMAVCSGILIVSSFFLIVIDTTIRMAGFQPPLYTTATVEYILLWFTMLAAPWLVRTKGHVFIDAGTQFLPPLIKRVVAKIVYTICIVASSIFFVNSLELFTEAWSNGALDVRSVDMPQWLLYMPIPLCFLFVTIEFIRYLIGIDDMYSHSISSREGM